jgi:zinc protease
MSESSDSEAKKRKVLDLIENPEQPSRRERQRQEAAKHRTIEDEKKDALDLFEEEEKNRGVHKTSQSGKTQLPSISKLLEDEDPEMIPAPPAEASPEAAFADTISALLTGHHPRTAPLTTARLDEIDLGTALRFYGDRYADAGDFHFVFVGAVELETLRPLVERYLASLPTVDRDDRWIDLDIDPPTGRIEREVRKGVEPRSQTRLAFTGPFEFTAENRIRMRALSSILEVRLRERLREDLGGTYSVGVSGGYQDTPESRYTFQIQFGADPARVEELQAAVFEEIERLQTDGPTALDVEKALESERRSWETDLEVNGWWAVQLAAAAERGTDPAFLLDETRFDWISAGAVREDAARYLNPGNVVVVTLLPEVPAGD